MKNSSIKISTVLILVLFITLTMITSCLGIYNYSRTRNSMTNELNASLERIATRLKINLISPFYDMDMPQIRAIVRSEMMNRNLFAVVLTEPDEFLFFSAARDEQWDFSEGSIVAFPDSGNYMKTTRTILLKDASVNTVKVIMTDVFLQKELRRLLVNMVIGVIFINITVILILYIALRVTLVDPISKLREYSIEVGTGNLDAERPRALFFGELADLNVALGDMVTSLKDFIERLKNMDRLKDEFLANTSHELRTPLNGIIGIAESLMEGAAGQPGDRMRSNLSMIVISGKRLAALVNDILDFSKLKTHSLELSTKSVHIRVITEVVLKLSQPLTAGKELILENRIGNDFPSVQADENRVQQILYNLIGNAIKFTDSGSVVISAREQNQMAEISVSDSGIGIAGNKFDDIFKSFEQINGSVAREYGGTGLGLSVTKQLVGLHGGTLRVESEVGKGSTFTFSLPLSGGGAAISLGSEEISGKIKEIAKIRDAREVVAPGDMGASPAEKEKGARADAHRILVVDDEMINQQVLKNVLSFGNYHVTQALNGKEALKAIETHKRFDLVLLDIMLPMMSGYEVCEKIRENHPSNELPIIMLSAKNQVTDLVEGLKTGANDYLTKPISQTELLARIETHLNLRELSAENVRMGAELDIARQLQEMVLPTPDELSRIEQLDIACHMEPAEEVGGDYYDILPHNGSLKIGIGDVTGHGLESGILMLMAQTAIRTLITADVTDPVRFLSILNSTIFNNVQRMQIDRMMTLSLLDYKDGRVRLSGHHEEMILVRKNGRVERVDTVDLGIFVGMMEDISEYIAETSVSLNPGDGMVLYTDGITEAHPAGLDPLPENLYGLDRLCDVVSRNWEKPAEGIRKAVIKDVHRHIEKKNGMRDDLTLLVLKQK